MPASEIRPRSVTEIVDVSFELLRRNYLTLITISAVFQLPLLLLQLYLSLDLSTPDKIMANAMGIFALTVLGMIALSVSDGAMILAVSDTYLGRKASVGRAIGETVRRTFAVTVLGTVRFIASYFLLFFFFVPGFYCYSRWGTARAACVLERRGAFDSLGRSWHLAENRAGACFLTLLLGWLIVMVLWVLYYALLSGVMGTQVFFAQSNVSMAVQRVPVIFVYPFVSVFTTVLYYDLRVRKEAFDLELMADELGTPAAPTTA